MHYIWVVYRLTALISGIVSDLHVMGNALYRTLPIVCVPCRINNAIVDVSLQNGVCVEIKIVLSTTVLLGRP